MYEQYGNFDEELEDKLRSGFISYDTYVTAKDNWGRCATGKGRASRTHNSKSILVCVFEKVSECAH
ncbi:WSSV102 [White spot syndrome virus]|uniref:WSSV102 n=1 Tax=White spot syndrome virus TaxID=342409 RepID=A0A2I6SBL7_9VIRU|nr:WSSV102 [White spot syndrome virus]